MMTRVLLAACAGLAAGIAACTEPAEPPAFLRIVGGEPERGRGLIQAYGCGTCHVIAGVRGARGRVGPPLEKFAERNLLAGAMPNVPRNLVAWLIDPPAVQPQTGMPAVGLSEADARHIAAYLYTLGTARAESYASGTLLELGRQADEPSRGEVVPGRR
jgi:cytochrome c1